MKLSKPLSERTTEELEKMLASAITVHDDLRRLVDEDHSAVKEMKEFALMIAKELDDRKTRR